MARPPTGFEGIPRSVMEAWAEEKPTKPKRDPGPEYLSAFQLAQLWGVQRAQANKRIRDLRQAGRIEVAIRDEERVGNGTYPVPVYRIKGGKAK